MTIEAMSMPHYEDKDPDTKKEIDQKTLRNLNIYLCNL